ncbi:MAG: hypothetical protein Q9162_002217 [Coniocarpon cinnabarinum]
MPPPWGRPPEGLDARARREWERRVHEWELNQNRFEEVDSDDESVSSAAYARYMGYDGPSRKQAVPVHAYADLTYGDEDDAENEYERNAEWQLAMREKEEELAERALRRIRRARLLGENNVNLSREELDALERRQRREELERRPPARAVQLEQQPRARQRASSSASTKPQAKRKPSGGGLFGLGGSPKSKPGRSERRHVSPQDDAQLQLPPVSSNSSLKRLSNGSPQASRRSSRNRAAQSAPQLLYDPQNPPNYRPSSSRSSRLAESPERSLPDDPDWVPRSRSASIAQSYPPPPQQSASGSVDPLAYQVSGPTARRIVSDPTSHNVAYSSVRRNPPRQAQVAARGRPMDVINISDDEEEEDEDELAGEDEGGVRVEVMPDSRGGYRVQQAGNAPRARKGRGR